MNEDDLKLEARLTAIEYLLSDLWAKWYAANGATNERVAKAHKDCLERLHLEGFPGMDPALGDAFSAELEDAVAAILSMQREMVAGLNLKLGRA